MYRNDVRYVRVWILLADASSKPDRVFQHMNEKKIGESTALFYEAWALFLEHAGFYDKADRVFLDVCQQSYPF